MRLLHGVLSGGWVCLSTAAMAIIIRNKEEEENLHFISCCSFPLMSP
jgi:hypothetical protein